MLRPLHLDHVHYELAVPRSLIDAGSRSRQEDRFVDGIGTADHHDPGRVARVFALLVGNIRDWIFRRATVGYGDLLPVQPGPYIGRISGLHGILEHGETPPRRLG